MSIYGDSYEHPEGILIYIDKQLIVGAALEVVLSCDNSSMYEMRIGYGLCWPSESQKVFGSYSLRNETRVHFLQSIKELPPSELAFNIASILNKRARRELCGALSGIPNYDDELEKDKKVNDQWVARFFSLANQVKTLTDPRTSKSDGDIIYIRDALVPIDDVLATGGLVEQDEKRLGSPHYIKNWLLDSNPIELPYPDDTGFSGSDCYRDTPIYAAIQCLYSSGLWNNLSKLPKETLKIKEPRSEEQFVRVDLLGVLRTTAPYATYQMVAPSGTRDGVKFKDTDDLGAKIGVCSDKYKRFSEYSRDYTKHTEDTSRRFYCLENGCRYLPDEFDDCFDGLREDASLSRKFPCQVVPIVVWKK
ncbi:hypothetical protein JCM15519_10120 [Fundidesulfovibrio butyratiphilus]